VYHFIKKNKKIQREGSKKPLPGTPTGFSQYKTLENKLRKHNQQPQTTKDLGIQDQRPSKELV